MLGTAAYLSPEQARGDEAGPASDIYSLGVCAYQFLAGRLPHEYGSLTELALKQQEEDVEPITVHRPDVPRELDAAVRACLARDPASRYASALDMARALEAGLHGAGHRRHRGAGLRRRGHPGADQRHRGHPGHAHAAHPGAVDDGAARRGAARPAARRPAGQAQAPPGQDRRPSSPCWRSRRS